jgi:hypothetical protein
LCSFIVEKVASNNLESDTEVKKEELVSLNFSPS